MARPRWSAPDQAASSPVSRGQRCPGDRGRAQPLPLPRPTRRAAHLHVVVRSKPIPGVFRCRAIAILARYSDSERTDRWRSSLWRLPSNSRPGRGIPTKTARFMLKGFQRAESSKHWQEVAGFFEDAQNISPTAIVVAFKPDRVKLTSLEVPTPPSAATSPCGGFTDSP